MHVLIPFASNTSEAAAHVLRDLNLPMLEELLRRLQPTDRDEGDETTLSAPHERALARACGWPLRDGALPFAAAAAAQDGIAVGNAAWCLLTPAHWSAGRDRVTMLDPATLQLGQAESRALCEALRALFESEGFTFAWGAPLRWYAAHPSLAYLPCASLDRVIGRDIESWLPPQQRSHLLRRLQSEAQLVFYTHAVNEEREARGELAVNSFWISGCGAQLPGIGGPVHLPGSGGLMHLPDSGGPAHLPDQRAALQQLESLRTPMLTGDWAGWAEAWRALDAGVLAQLVQRCEAGETVALTLSGSRNWQRFDAVPLSWWRRAASEHFFHCERVNCKSVGIGI